MYYYLRSSGALPDQEWVGTTAFDQYFGTGLIVLWVALVQVGGVWRWINGHEASAEFWAGFLVLFLFFVLARYVQNLSRQGVLHESKS